MIPYLHARNYIDTIQVILAWSLACGITAFLTETGKLTIGRPRPDFFFRCFPNEKVTNDLNCTGNFKDVMEGRKSFPSRHSSLSFCSLGFVSVWLCGKFGVLSRNREHGVRILSCLAPLVMAGVVAMSRCCGHHHQWEDVVAGSIIGFTSSYFCYRQYYHPLDSEVSGTPYVFDTKQLWDEATFELECCSKDLDTEILNVTNYNPVLILNIPTSKTFRSFFKSYKITAALFTFRSFCLVCNPLVQSIGWRGRTPPLKGGISEI